MATEFYGPATAHATAEPKVDSCVDQLEGIEGLTRQIWQDLFAIRETISPRPITDGQAQECPVGLYNRLVNHRDELAEMSRFVLDIRRQMGG